ncbi:MAG: sulfatase-like hydrolase/transferase, partial [Phycisphaerae bacterium]|nr:sulfatase-like hydrolase/transferase [Phycisphaerae bacterium]
ERTHRFTFGTPPISKDFVQDSYPVVLRKAGYRTGFVGKFGVGIAGKSSDMFDSFKPLNRNPYFKKQPDGTERHVTEIAGDHAINFIEEAKAGQPFCLSVSFNAAHAEDRDKVNHFPWPQAENGLYDDVKIPLPKLSDPSVFEGQPEFLKKSMNRQRYFWRWDTPEKYQRNVKGYYRMITGLDRVIGRVLEALEKRGHTDNTVVVFAGDNGYYKGSRGFAGKWSHYEESLRVPLVIFDPRALPDHRGHVVSLPVLNVDIPATILAYAGLERPDRYQGESLVPLAQRNALRNWRSDFFCEHLMNNSAIPKWEGVRGGRYVYARYFEQEPVYEFLHDLRSDPDQLRNLAAEKNSAQVLEGMRRRCDELRDNYGGVFKAWPRGGQRGKAGKR